MESTIDIKSSLEMAFAEFSKCVDFLGADKTLRALKNFRFSESNIHDESVQFVFEQVTARLDITIEELFHARDWSLNRTMAIGICTKIFYWYFDYSANQIALLLKKSKGSCWNNMKKFDKLDERFPTEKTIIDSYTIIRQNVELYLEKNPLPNG